MAFKLSQQTVDSTSFLNPRNGWIVPDVIGIINLMVNTPQKTTETGIIKFSKDISSYKEKLLTYFFEDDVKTKNAWKMKSSYSMGTKKIVSHPETHQCASVLKIFYKLGIIQCIGHDFNKCKEFLMKNIFTDLEITESKITLTNYSYDLGTNIDFARFHPKIDPKLEAKSSQSPLWKIIIKYSGITYIIFESGKMIISSLCTNSPTEVLNYLIRLVSCYLTLERPLTF
jgi:hypothetical protein